MEKHASPPLHSIEVLSETPSAEKAVGSFRLSSAGELLAGLTNVVANATSLEYQTDPAVVCDIRGAGACDCSIEGLPYHVAGRPAGAAGADVDTTDSLGEDSRRLGVQSPCIHGVADVRPDLGLCMELNPAGDTHALSPKAATPTNLDVAGTATPNVIPVDLPLDVLRYIFCLLPVDFLVNTVAWVCHDWQMAVVTSLGKSVNLSASTDVVDRTLFALVRLLGSFGVELRLLDLTGCRCAKPVILLLRQPRSWSRTLVSRLSRVSLLFVIIPLENIERHLMTPPSLPPQTLRWPNWRERTLSTMYKLLHMCWPCRGISEAGLGAICRQMPSIEVLTLSQLHLEASGHRHLRLLNSLKVRNCGSLPTRWCAVPCVVRLCADSEVISSLDPTYFVT